MKYLIAICCLLVFIVGCSEHAYYPRHSPYQGFMDGYYLYPRYGPSPYIDYDRAYNSMADSWRNRNDNYWQEEYYMQQVLK